MLILILIINNIARTKQTAQRSVSRKSLPKPLVSKVTRKSILNKTKKRRLKLGNK